MTVPPSKRGRRMHHVGYVVHSIDSCVQGFQRSLDAVWDGVVFEDRCQKVKVAFLSTGDSDTLIELVEPNAADAPVRRFLAETGGGLHHVCYEVDELDRELAATRTRGGLIAKRPMAAVAFGGRRIAWIITAEKLLVELLETAALREPAG